MLRIPLCILALAGALVAAPALAATLRGEVVAVEAGSITVVSDGREVTYLLPADVQVETPQQRAGTLRQLQPGQVVVLTVDEGEVVEAAPMPAASIIRVERDGDDEEIDAGEDDDDDDDDD